jgi:beta-mannosidase
VRPFFVSDRFQSFTVELDAAWRFKQADDAVWLPAQVPGCVHLDLVKNGVISEPFYRTNERDAQWVETKNWEYRCEFRAESEWRGYENLELDFAGLDTFAEVYLNKKLILRADNMFVGWRVAVREHLLFDAPNELQISFQSPINRALPQYEASRFRFPAVNDQAETQVSVYARKAPYHYGWDWGPRLVTSGVWRPVRLCGWNEARIESLRVKQNKLDAQEARLTLAVEVNSLYAGPAELDLTLSDDNSRLRRAVQVMLKTGPQTLTLPLNINQPQLWWPHGLGTQHLYQVEVELNTPAGGDKARQRFGLRSLAVVNEQDALGESFFVQVNGVPVFMKGANYVPPDSFPARITRERYRQLFEDMRDANFNMARVWGGGYYEDDYFYELADEYGILIWQDFMFACSLYPFYQAFLQNIEREAEYNVKRLRHHPSLALWCGNNEIAVAWKEWGWQQNYGYTEEDKRELERGYAAIFDEILPQTVAKHDAGRFYFPSSPVSGWGSPAEFTRGDNHFWGVWHGEWPLEDFQTYIPRFMSEYGFQSFPDIVSTQRFALPEDYDIQSEVMRHHQRCHKGNGLIQRYLEEWYHPPKDFPAFLYVNQLLQAEAIKIAIEAHRRARPYCMGTLYWQLNDCWPGPSWAGIDYYGRWKALHHAAAKSFAPLLVSPLVEGGRVGVYVVSDLLKPLKATLRMQLRHFNGLTLWESSHIITVAPNESRLYFDEMLADLGAGSEQETLFCAQLLTDEGVIAENTLYFTKPRYLNLPAPEIKYEFAAPQDDELRLIVSSPALAKNVFLLVKDDSEARFSDNYFDLLPSQPKTIKVRSKFALEEITHKMEAITLYDSY